MLEIFKAESSKVLPYITEKLHEIEGLDVREEVEVLLLQLATDPEGTAMFVIFEDEELVAFIYGWLHDSTKYVWLANAWGSTKIKTTYKQELFDRFLDWGKELGAEEIRAQTKRKNMKAWEKTYGLTELAVILYKEI